MSADPFDWRRPAPDRPYAEVIGDPIAQSKSRLIHNFWLAKLGIDAEYRASQVRAEELADYFVLRRTEPCWRGCNITMPHKGAAMRLLDRLDPLAKRVGAVNTVVGGAGGALTGYNTDVGGFLEPLGDGLPECVTLIGAGGAARAVLAGLSQGPIRWVSLQNRDVGRGQALLAQFGINGCAVALGDAVPTAQLLINASSLGMAGFPEAPSAEQFVADGGTVFDIVTHPLDTELLQRARARGHKTIDGLEMLVAQAAAAFEHFFAAKPPRDDGDGELRALLTA